MPNFNPCVEYCNRRFSKQYDPIECKECDFAKAVSELKQYKKFKEFFDDLYQQGLEIANWHLNGDTEPFDNFYQLAVNCMCGE